METEGSEAPRTVATTTKVVNFKQITTIGSIFTFTTSLLLLPQR